MRNRLIVASIFSAALIACAVWMVWPRSPGQDAVAAPPPAASTVDRETRARIDRWIAENRLNEFGDAPGTHYAGGTPLFDSSTGVRTGRYEYILKKHPDLSAQTKR